MMIEGEVQQVVDALREAGSAAADIVEQCLPVLVAEARLSAIVSVVTYLVAAIILGGAANLLFRGGRAMKVRSQDDALSRVQRADAGACAGGTFFVCVLLVLMAFGLTLSGLCQMGNIVRPYMVVVEWLLAASQYGAFPAP